MGIVREHAIDRNSYKRHRILMLCLIVFFIPVVVLLSYLQARLNLPSALRSVFVVGWIVFMFWAGARFSLWPCKNCGKSFRGMSPVLPKGCAHCKSLR